MGCGGQRVKRNAQCGDPVSDVDAAGQRPHLKLGLHRLARHCHLEIHEIVGLAEGNADVRFEITRRLDLRHGAGHQIGAWLIFHIAEDIIDAHFILGDEQFFVDHGDAVGIDEDDATSTELGNGIIGQCRSGERGGERQCGGKAFHGGDPQSRWRQPGSF